MGFLTKNTSANLDAEQEQDNNSPAKPDLKSGDVEFVSNARGKRVYGKDGKKIAKFEDGKFSTSDPKVVKVLDGLPDVRRAGD